MHRRLSICKGPSSTPPTQRGMIYNILASFRGSGHGQFEAIVLGFWAAMLLCGGIACSPAGGSKGPVKLLGAGASFPAPLYDKWFNAYHAAHPDVQINYQSVDSGSGVKGVIDKAVDFGAGDAAMTGEEMRKVEGACNCCR